ncbi:hypothetical protein I8748_27790 [Nostoc sp. CENA67]|uniref:Uncharacterized protein n=1 Tax=Amazonocrinis nigriterrae CENA67 TaxID=2794033 RepID=A0A8J7HYF0_9NOST|nr:hypothetical protein [Amazonocrinis nigriterrae]MBH8565925.1 hypothetical protein [Amazonocrinis nigriterrae CENA67]
MVSPIDRKDLSPSVVNAGVFCLAHHNAPAPSLKFPLYETRLRERLKKSDRN